MCDVGRRKEIYYRESCLLGRSEEQTHVREPEERRLRFHPPWYLSYGFYGRPITRGAASEAAG